MSLLEAHQLSVSVADKQICSNLDICLEPGQIWAVLGSNGAGKTTLLHTLAGLRTPDSGRIELSGQPIEQMKRREIAQHLGLLFQQQDEPFPSTVLETALIGRHPFIDSWRWETRQDIDIAERALNRVGLEGFNHRFSSTLSGGEKQRLKIATLLTQNPLLMLLDEPTNHLDLHHQIRLLTLLTEQCRERAGALFMVLHDINLATRFCSHAMLLQPDDNPLVGSLEQVLQPDHLERAYGWPIDRITQGENTYYYPR